MTKSHWINAIVATATLFVLASVMMGLQLSLDGTRLIVRNADAVRWEWIGTGCVIVFIFQLVRPSLKKLTARLPKSSCSLPGFDGSTNTQKIIAG